jgi:hypothetical protein
MAVAVARFVLVLLLFSPSIFWKENGGDHQRKRSETVGTNVYLYGALRGQGVVVSTVDQR